MVKDIPPCFANAWYIWGIRLAGDAARKLSGGMATWSKKPMPVDMSMFCASPEPGAQSRQRDTSICVSFVFLETVAVLAVIWAEGLNVAKSVQFVDN